MKPDLLLHACCGPCATQAIEVLQEDFRPICFFLNPNIHPEEEFQARLEALTRVSRHYHVHLWIPPYRPEEWFEAVRGYEREPEGGARCGICFRFRLEATARAARAASLSHFATTLTIGPRKDSGRINALGGEIALRYGLAYHGRDFKKQDGFRKSVEKSRQLGLYRQRSCGCRFSRDETPA